MSYLKSPPKITRYIFILISIIAIVLIGGIDTSNDLETLFQGVGFTFFVTTAIYYIRIGSFLKTK